MPLRLLFWNCSVAPTRGTGSRSAVDTAVIIRRAFEEGIELVALCEVDELALEVIRAELDSASVRVLSLTDPVGRSRWDLGVIHGRGLTCDDRTPVIGLAFGKRIRAARRLIVTELAGDREFVLYLSHWPSRVRTSGFDLRAGASHCLREAVRADLEDRRPVVVLGDFNEEPFDSPMTTLHSSRDPRRVVRDPQTWLYNPCWWLAAPSGDDPWGRFGSAAYAGKTSRSYLLDQALTSAAFLDEKSRSAPSVRLVELPLTAGSRTMEHAPLELTLP